MIKIVEVEKDSVSEELGIKSGSFLCRINNKKPLDSLDFMYECGKRKIKVDVLQNNEMVTYKFVKGDFEKVGIILEEFDEIKTQICQNRCIFCFIHQMPKGMRKTLYVRDDDYRLSFISGNYVTLTNCTKFDIKRIAKQKLCPIYISVHATDLNVRNKLLGRTKTNNINKILKYFYRKKILMNCQIVLCPGINDGAVLKKTIQDLSKLYPYVQSVAIVPVGLTKYRKGLTEIVPFTKQTAKSALLIIEEEQNKLKEKFGTNFAFASDELYLKAEEEIPNATSYGEFEQIEDGVGKIALQRKEFQEIMEEEFSSAKNAQFTIITGKLAEKEMQNLANQFTDRFKNVKVNVLAIENEFFGKQVTVAGLVTATDILAQANETNSYEKIIIPSCMLKEKENIFLDDITVKELSKKLNKKVIISSSTEELVKILLGEIDEKTTSRNRWKI